MKPVEAIDTASKLLALASVILHQLGYIDKSTLAAMLSALTAVMASILLHSHRHRVRNAIKSIRKPRLFLVKTLQGETIPIQQTCRICSREDREVIDNLIRKGVNPRDIVKVVENLSLDELSNHVKHSGGLDKDKLREAYRIKEIDLREEMFRLLERLNQLYEKLERLDESFQEGRVNPRIYIDSIGERRQLLSKIRETIITITKLKTDLRTTQQLSELLQRLRSA